MNSLAVIVCILLISGLTSALVANMVTGYYMEAFHDVLDYAEECLKEDLGENG